MEKEIYTISEACEKLGVSRHAVGRLCSQGLVPYVRRSGRAGYRMLEPWQIDLVKVLLGMKQAGFRPREIRQYARLFREGKTTSAERLAMLTTRKRQLWQEITARQQAIDFIERQEEISAQNPPKM